MNDADYEISYEEVKNSLLNDPEAALEYRKLKTGSEFSRLIMSAANKIAEESGLPAEKIDKNIAEKSGIGYERYMAILADSDETTLLETQLIAMCLGYDAKVVSIPHKE